jgi:hypothetical protein
MLICPSRASQWIKPETAGQQATGDRVPTEDRPQEAARRPAQTLAPQEFGEDQGRNYLAKYLI